MRRLRVNENILTGKLLEALGYDAIIYDNMGEAGGKAIIVWKTSQIKKVDEN